MKGGRFGNFALTQEFRNSEMFHHIARDFPRLIFAFDGKSNLFKGSGECAQFDELGPNEPTPFYIGYFKTYPSGTSVFQWRRADPVADLNISPELLSSWPSIRNMGGAC